MGWAFSLCVCLSLSVEPGMGCALDACARGPRIPNPARSLAPPRQACFANGYSAVAFDQRVYLSLNPFAVYVDQAVIKPGCVLRMSTWKELERRNLVTPDDVATCKKAMNTFAYVGDLNDSPEISCVYQSDDAHNDYLSAMKGIKDGEGGGARADGRESSRLCASRGLQVS